MLIVENTTDCELNAWIDPHFDNDWSRGHCFLRAAQELIEISIETPGVRGIYAIPILHLIRHSIELELKRLIADSEDLYFGILEPWGWKKSDVRKRVEDELVRTHSIRKLSDFLDERIRACLGEELDAELRAVLNELDRLDPSGIAFRYSAARDGSSSISTKLQFDLQHLKAQLLLLPRKFIYLESGLVYEREISTDYIGECRE